MEDFRRFTPYRIFSGENLKTTITTLEDALTQLRGLQTASTEDVEANSARMFSDDQAIATLTDGLEKLRAL
jgi:hypothetical protein